VRYVNVPNVISMVRLLAAPGLIVLAAWDMAAAFLALAILLLLTDWIDGHLARAWNQQTTFGARLDSISDATIYAFIAVGVWVLRPAEFWAERYWLIALAASYAVSLAASFVKFGRLPSYHLRSAKVSWLLTTAGVVAFLFGYPWPIRLAMATVTASNLEAIAVTLTLGRWRTDLNSLADAVRDPIGSTETQSPSELGPPSQPLPP
jgi:CDP-diacylglycerol--glycerol-3-phosphate 3-phosphatidyltransferase